MSVFNKCRATPLGRLLVVGWFLSALCACSLLSSTPTTPTVYYALDRAVTIAPSPGTTTAALRDQAPTLIVNPTHAAAGFDSPRIVYLREAHRLNYFAHSEWVDPPARMLAPLLVAAIANSGAFRAVVPTPGAASGDLRLDTEIIRLQHEFQSSPSRVRFTLRATLVDDRTRRVLAWREFEALVPAASEDPYGGVLAANQAVQNVLQDLSQFLIERQP
jgi:cholesterol transport system auxiliary component